jgi:hypothetical protein
MTTTKALLCFCCVFARFLSVDSTSKWGTCAGTSQEASDVQINAFSMLPNPPTRGRAVVVSVEGYSNVEVASAKMDVKVFYLGFKVHSAQGDLCASLACPMAPGHMLLNMSFTMSSYAPPGLYILQLTVFPTINAQLQDGVFKKHQEVKKLSALILVRSLLRSISAWMNSALWPLIKRANKVSADLGAKELFCVELQFSPE